VRGCRPFALLREPTADSVVKVILVVVALGSCVCFCQPYRILCLIIPTSSIGAPAVSNEKIERGDECLRAVEVLEDYLGRRAAAVITDEIGGTNALEPMIVAALKDVVVDADGMGRAFPEVQMTTFFIYGLDPYPTALADEKGNRVLFRNAKSAVWLKRAARAVTIQMGCSAGMAGPPMTVRQAKKEAIPGRSAARGGSVKRWSRLVRQSEIRSPQ